MTHALLRAEHISKSFGGVQALKDVSLTLNAGEIYGLIGPNGAGKTTAFNCISGIFDTCFPRWETDFPTKFNCFVNQVLACIISVRT